MYIHIIKTVTNAIFLECTKNILIFLQHTQKAKLAKATAPRFCFSSFNDDILSSFSFSIAPHQNVLHHTKINSSFLVYLFVQNSNFEKSCFCKLTYFTSFLNCSSVYFLVYSINLFYIKLNIFNTTIKYKYVHLLNFI